MATERYDRDSSNIPEEDFHRFQAELAQTDTVRWINGFAENFIKAWQSTTNSFWYRFLTRYLPNPLVEGLVEDQILMSIDKKFDDKLPEFLAAFSLSSDRSPSEKALLNRFLCFHLASSLVDRAQELDQPRIADLILLAARRFLLYAVHETESTEQKIVNKEWLNGFILSVQNQKILPEDVIKFIHDPPVVN